MKRSIMWQSKIINNPLYEIAASLCSLGCTKSQAERNDKKDQLKQNGA